MFWTFTGNSVLPTFIPMPSFDPNTGAARDPSYLPYSTYSTAEMIGCSQSTIPTRLSQKVGSHDLSSGFTTVLTTQQYQLHIDRIRKQQNGGVQIKPSGDDVLARRGAGRTAARLESERRRRHELKASFEKLRSTLGASNVRVRKRDLHERAICALGRFKQNEGEMLQELKYLRGVDRKGIPNCRQC
jgi:hypothetical protein